MVQYYFNCVQKPSKSQQKSLQIEMYYFLAANPAVVSPHNSDVARVTNVNSMVSDLGFIFKHDSQQITV